MAALERVHTAKNADALHVVFIHGWGGDAKKTWMHDPENEETLLPKWIGEDLDCHAWCLGYDAAISGWQDSAMSIPDQGRAVLNALTVETELSKGQGKIVLMGHSMGGLVIKAALLLAAHEAGNDDAVLKRVVGVGFIATPHQGAQLSSLANALGLILKTNPQVGNRERNDSYLRQMNQQFRRLFTERGFKALVLAEMHPVKVSKPFLKFFTETVSVMVMPDSADSGLNGVKVAPFPEDHFSIAKPKSNKEPLYKTIKKFITDASTTPTPSRSTSPLPPSTPLPTSTSKSLQSNDARLQSRERKVYGREKEIAQVVAFLQSDADASILEITGAGGIGKTELCKAALQEWLKQKPDAVAYYVSIPDRGSVGDLVSRLAAAIGAIQIESPAQLLAVLPPALYYLDNLGSVVESTEGQQLLRDLKDTSGVRLLVSSRFNAQSIFGNPLALGALPDEAARALFRDVWTGQALPDDAAFCDFVLKDLGAHALSITITARLGDCYAFNDLVERWRSIGTQVAADVGDDSHLGNLNTSLRLTAQMLGQTAGALELWMLSALFPSGVPHDVLQQFERLGGWQIAARHLLVRHHVLAQRGEHWYMLPPLARYARAASQHQETGFAWAQCGPLARKVFDAPLKAVDSIASTPEKLAARAWLVQHFDALAQTMRHELSMEEREAAWLSSTHTHLINVYPFQPVLARDLLRFLDQHDIAQASVKQSLGDLESHLGQVATAGRLYERALALSQAEQNRLGQANALKALGDLERRLGQVDTARSLYEQALKLYESEQNGLGQAHTLKALGDLERRLGQGDTARGLYERALKLYESEQNGLGQAHTLKAWGDWASCFEPVDTARDLHNPVLITVENLNKHVLALALYHQALNLYKAEQDGLGQAHTLKAAGDLQTRLGRFDIARGLYDQALNLYKAEQNRLGQANTLKALGDLQSRLGQVDTARGWYDQAFQLFQAERDGLGQAHILKAIADLENRFGKVDTDDGLYHQGFVLFLYQQALEMYESEQDGQGQANTLKAMGDLESRWGQVDTARGLYEQALKLYESEQEPPGLAYTYAELARCHHVLNQHSLCKQALKEARAWARKSNTPRVQDYVEQVKNQINGR